jgi:hypothetical protein
MGYSITVATNGPKAGHFFMVEVTGQIATVHEFDGDWNWLGEFTVSSSHADAHPGDAIAYNSVSMDLMITDEVYRDFFEVTTSGALVRSFSGALVQGMSFNAATGTFWGVNTSDTLMELSPQGAVLRQMDLHSYGITQPVGLATDGAHLFIADEVNDDGNGGGTEGFVFLITRPGL